MQSLCAHLALRREKKERKKERRCHSPTRLSTKFTLRCDWRTKQGGGRRQLLDCATRPFVRRPCLRCSGGTALSVGFVIPPLMTLRRHRGPASFVEFGAACRQHSPSDTKSTGFVEVDEIELCEETPSREKIEEEEDEAEEDKEGAYGCFCC